LRHRFVVVVLFFLTSFFFFFVSVLFVGVEGIFSFELLDLDPCSFTVSYCCVLGGCFFVEACGGFVESSFVDTSWIPSRLTVAAVTILLFFCSRHGSLVGFFSGRDCLNSEKVAELFFGFFYVRDQFFDLTVVNSLSAHAMTTAIASLGSCSSF
jgi:hypothetical protein